MNRGGENATSRPPGLGRFEWILFIAIAAILILQLLIPPIVGLADNGDYGRVLEPLGLRPVAEEWGDKYFLYVNRDYTSAPRKTAPLLSSEQWLAEAARRLDRLVTRDDRTELLFLGAIQLALYLLGIFLVLSAARTFSGPGRAVLGLGLLAATTDVAYVATLNSFYTESASLVFLAILMGLVLRRVRGLGPCRWWLAAYFTAAALFVSAKPQNYLLSLPLALLPLALIWKKSRGSGRWVATLPALGLLLWTGYLYQRVERSFQMPILWDTLFYSILPLSPSPEQDLKEFGLEPELAKYSGTTSWDAGVPFFETASRYNYGDIARFYLRHPERLLGICAACSRHAFKWREPLLGNFTKDSGRPPRSQSSSFSGWSEFENRLFPKSIWFLAAFFILVFAVCVWELATNGMARTRGATSCVVLTVAVMAVLEFLSSVAVEGPKDIVKHLYLFQVLFDACFLAATAYGAERLGRNLPWGWWRSVSVSGD